MSDPKLFLTCEIKCNDCRGVAAVQMIAVLDSRNTVIAEPWNIELPDGWAKVPFDALNMWEEEGYLCYNCIDARARKHEKELAEISKSEEKRLGLKKSAEKAEGKTLSKKQIKKQAKKLKKAHSK